MKAPFLRGFLALDALLHRKPGRLRPRRLILRNPVVPHRQGLLQIASTNRSCEVEPPPGFADSASARPERLSGPMKPPTGGSSVRQPNVRHAPKLAPRACDFQIKVEGAGQRLLQRRPMNAGRWPGAHRGLSRRPRSGEPANNLPPGPAIAYRDRRAEKARHELAYRLPSAHPGVCVPELTGAALLRSCSAPSKRGHVPRRIR